MPKALRAGAAAVDISPIDSQFLFGYPHVERYSTGVHDPLYSTALYLSDGREEVVFVANDIVFVSKTSVTEARRRIAESTTVPSENIMITATHTHSGPITVDYISNEADAVVPKASEDYVKLMVDGIVAAASKAYNNAQPAQIGLKIADDTGVGTNRRDTAGPADHQVPVLMVRNADGSSNIACMLVCSMHPTVMHEDSTLVSGDFPAMARQYLQRNVLGANCPVLHCTGPAGNQSPRHVTKANTFEEAQRLGEILGSAVEKVVGQIEYQSHIEMSCQRIFVDLPRRGFPAVADAEAQLREAIAKLEHLRQSNAPSQQTRTAECDWFGAEETLTLAQAASDGRLDTAYQCCMPAEIQIVKIGPWSFVGWQGEVFIEYSLAVKKQCANAFVISVANGELQGYIVTEQAAKEGGYEASNALFSHESGDILVKKTLKLLGAD